MNTQQTTSALWVTPESVRTAPKYPSNAAAAAQNMISVMDATPLSSPLTRYDWETLARQAEYDAQTEYLNRLAAW